MGMGGIEWPKNRMISRRVSSLVDRARFLLPGHEGWRSQGGDAEHVRRRSLLSRYAKRVKFLFEMNKE